MEAHDDAQRDYWDALATADRPRAQRVVAGLLDGGWSATQVVERLIRPSQEEIGELWLRGEWSVAREHAATAVNEAVVHWLISQLPPPREDAPLVMVSCFQGERHSLPALIIAEGLASRGLRVVFVGADPEPSSLLVEILTRRPRAILFSASLTSTLSAHKEFFHSVAAVGIPLIVGGRAFGGRELGAKRARVLGATAYAESVPEVMDLLSWLPPRTPVGDWPYGVRGDEDAVWLAHYRSEIVPEVMRLLTQRHHADPDSDLAEHWPEVADHVEHVLGCLAAAIVTEDETIMVEVRDWLVTVLTHRGVDPSLVDEVWELLAEPLRGHPIARVFLASSRRPA